MADSGQDLKPIREWVERAQSGDEHAFTRLYERYEYRLGSLVYFRIRKDMAKLIDIDDVLQEVWLRAYEQIKRFEWRGDGSFFHWLGGIADNQIKQQIRYHNVPGRKNQRSIDESDLRRQGLPYDRDRRQRRSDPSPSERMRRDERFKALRDALWSLSDVRRDIVILAKIRGLPIQEIAVLLGRSAGAVSTQLFRALREMSEKLKGTDSFRLPPRSLDPGAPKRSPSGNGRNGSEEDPPPPSEGDSDREER